jgi:hypothetical protein
MVDYWGDACRGILSDPALLAAWEAHIAQLRALFAGKQILLALYMKPQAVRRNLQMFNDLLCAFHRWYLENLPLAQLQTVVAGQRAQPPGHGQIRGCTTQPLSPPALPGVPCAPGWRAAFHLPPRRHDPPVRPAHPAHPDSAGDALPAGHPAPRPGWHRPADRPFLVLRTGCSAGRRYAIALWIPRQPMILNKENHNDAASIGYYSPLSS